MIHFATCERKTAFGYLQSVYKSKEVTEQMCSKLLNLVSKDIVRVQDPYMHGNRIAVIAGTNYKPENKKDIEEAVAQLHENDLL
jgi:hypothetical protein